MSSRRSTLSRPGCPRQTRPPAPLLNSDPERRTTQRLVCYVRINRSPSPRRPPAGSGSAAPPEAAAGWDCRQPRTLRVAGASRTPHDPKSQSERHVAVTRDQTGLRRAARRSCDRATRPSLGVLPAEAPTYGGHASAEAGRPARRPRLVHGRPLSRCFLLDRLDARSWAARVTSRQWLPGYSPDARERG